jgi:Flp pilus assembly protein TadB
VFAFVLVLLVTWLLPPDAPVAVWVGQSVLYTGLAVAIFAWRRRKDGREAGVSSRQVMSLDRYVLDEEVPREPERREELRKLVRQRRALLRRTRWAAPVFAGCAVLPSVAFALLGRRAVAVVLLAVMAGVVAWVLWLRRRNAGRLERMQAALEDRAG